MGSSPTAYATVPSFNGQDAPCHGGNTGSTPVGTATLSFYGEPTAPPIEEIVHPCHRDINDGINPLAGMQYYTFADDDDRRTYITSQPDLLHMSFILAHAGVPNANGDCISEPLMRQIWPTAVFKPIDVEHDKPTIGTIIHAEYVRDADPPYVQCEAVVWNMFYPQMASQIRRDWASKGLRMSMELLFQECEYHWGNRVFSEAEAVRLGLDRHRGQEYQGEYVSRWFLPKNACFGGAAVVRDPADSEAVILAAARSERSRWKAYHDLLHQLWEAQDFSQISAAHILRDHQWLHDHGFHEGR